jgi:acyl-CoA synthetase (AMP-forming)/AMP-acid ligase II
LLSEILKKIVEESTNEGIRFIEHTTEVFVSYKELYNDAIGLGEWLKEKGMKPGESLVILLQNRKNFITTFWTCLIFGYTAIPVDYISAWNKSWGIKNVENVFQNITNNKVITDKKQYEIISQNKYIKSSDIFIFPEIENIKRDWKKNWFKVIDTEYPAVILFTSGSVFLPKGVVLTTENLLNGIEQVIQKIHYNKSDVIINWMPLTHVAGLLLLHLIPLCSGANEVVVSTEDFLRNPRGFFDYVKKYKGTVTMFPNFAVEMLVNYGKKNDISSIDISSLRCVFNGAEPINCTNMYKFIELYKKCGFRKNAMVAVYGMTETTTAVTIHDPAKCEDRFLRIDKKKYFSENILIECNSAEKKEYFDIAYVGKPVHGVSIKICDENGNEVKQGEIGNIFVSGSNVAKQILSNKQYCPLIGQNNYLETGDMGTMINGQLIVTGRKKDIMFFNGLNYYPEDIEKLCKEKLKEICVDYIACAIQNKELMKDELVIFVENNLFESELIEKRIKDTISTTIHQPVKYVIPVKKLSRNRIGKKQRKEMKERYEKGEFEDYIKKIEARNF